MMVVVLAKILQLFKLATTNHLPQQQKQLIDILFLLNNYRLNTIFLIAMKIFWQF